jgi:hypothetical protein
MDDPIRPEDKLKLVRVKARSFFEQLDAQESARQLAEPRRPDHLVNPLGPDQLNLFLRALNSRLRSAIVEVRASAQDLTELAAEVRRVEARWGQGD